MKKGEHVVGDCIHIRSWLMMLNRGTSITIIPGSLDHTTIYHLLDYLERDMLWMQSTVAQVRSDIRKPDAQQASIDRRNRTRNKALRVRRQIDKYFEIHGKPNERGDDQYAEDDHDAETAVSQDS